MMATLLRWMATLLLLYSTGVWAQADNYPSRPIRLIVSIGPGSGADLMCRTLAEQLTGQFGQPVIVENKPGAEGVVAVQALLAAPADGYTFMMVSPGSLIINTLTLATPPFKVADLRPVVGMARVTGVVAVAPTDRFPTWTALLEAAHLAPGKLTMGNYGAIYRISAQMLESRVGVAFNHVAYKGFGPTSTDIIGGSIDTGLIDAGGSAPLIRAGKLRGLAVTSRGRLASLPDVPTLRELGVNDYDPPIWVGMAMRAQTPEPIARKLEAALQQAMTSTAWADVLARQGNLEPWAIDSRAFARVIAEDTEFFARAISAAPAGQAPR